MSVAANISTAQLEKKILESIETGDAAEGQLESNDRIISRVTDGIYREPWSAFRELVSNAYDADAKSVSIDCDDPFFNQIRISDDGIGMDSKTVADLLTNIGGSSKRTSRGKDLGTVNPMDPTESPSGRKLIGKIGIGIFAVAQLTNHFQIITKRAGSNERVSATVLINTFRENAEVEGDSEENFIPGIFKVIAEKTSDVDAHGTTIILMNVQQAVKEKLQSLDIWEALDEQAEAENDSGGLIDAVREPNFHIGRVGKDKTLVVEAILPWTSKDNPRQRFQKLFDATVAAEGDYRDRADLSHLDNYLQMVWRLALGSPVEYLNEHPFDTSGERNFGFYKLSNEPKGQASEFALPQGKTVREVLQLKSGNRDPLRGFAVFIDGVQLFRPISLPEVLMGNQALERPLFFAGKVKTNFGGASQDRSGGRLAFEAYLYWNSKIIPKESIGALIRVNGASGTLFDPDYLGYKIAEQTRKRQLTCEIFVLEGLDGALNIDRESYNTSHPHYLYIQKWLHNAFRQYANQHKKIGSQVRAQEAERRANLTLDRLDRQTEEVWERMRGTDYALPTIEKGGNSENTELPNSISGNRIKWDSERINPASLTRVERIDAIAVILEAYGLLENLDDEQRADLIYDIISVFED